MMNLIYYFWKVWLKISHTEPSAKDEFSIEVSTQKTIKTNKDIAERLVIEGIDVSYNTLLYVINQYERTLRDMLCEGFTVQTKNVTFTPHVISDFEINMEFSSKVYKPTVECQLNSEVHQTLDLIGIKVLGIKDSQIYISKITDMKTQSVDSQISCNGELAIEGNNIKAIGKDGTTNGCIFLIKSERISYDIGINLIVNEPNLITLRIPMGLEKGKYHLAIHTFFSNDNSRKQEYGRQIEFDKTLIVS